MFEAEEYQLNLSKHAKALTSQASVVIGSVNSWFSNLCGN